MSQSCEEEPEFTFAKLRRMERAFRQDVEGSSHEDELVFPCRRSKVSVHLSLQS